MDKLTATSEPHQSTPGFRRGPILIGLVMTTLGALLMPDYAPGSRIMPGIEVFFLGGWVVFAPVAVLVELVSQIRSRSPLNGFTCFVVSWVFSSIAYFVVATWKPTGRTAQELLSAGSHCGSDADCLIEYGYGVCGSAISTQQKVGLENETIAPFNRICPDRPRKPIADIAVCFEGFCRVRSELPSPDAVPPGHQVVTIELGDKPDYRFSLKLYPHADIFCTHAAESEQLYTTELVAQSVRVRSPSLERVSSDEGERPIHVVSVVVTEEIAAKIQAAKTRCSLSVLPSPSSF